MSYLDFDIESSEDNWCSTDYILIRNGNDNTTSTGHESVLPIMAKQCGSKVPSELLFKGKRVLIIFNSNHENVDRARGFKMTYHIIKERSQINNCFYSFLELNVRQNL